MPTKDNWGNQELPNISNEELLSEDFARRVRYAGNSEILKLLFQDVTFKARHQKAIAKAMAERADSPEFVDIVEKIRISNIKYRKNNPYTEEEKKRIGDAMRGKTLEELLGEEKASAGREARRQSNFKQDYTGRGDKIAATRKANGSYKSPTHGMNDKKHTSATKGKMSSKATVKNQLKRDLGLGRNDIVPKDLLEAAYKKQGLL